MTIAAFTVSEWDMTVAIGAVIIFATIIFAGIVEGLLELRRHKARRAYADKMVLKALRQGSSELRVAGIRFKKGEDADHRGNIKL